MTASHNAIKNGATRSTLLISERCVRRQRNASKWLVQLLIKVARQAPWHTAGQGL